MKMDKVAGSGNDKLFRKYPIKDGKENHND